ncbi:MAG: amidophosphoribosyltransferase [Thermoguttaceae bacterium]
MSIHDECGVIAIYHLPGDSTSPLCPPQGPEEISRLVPRMLLDLQNRGQHSTGFTTYSPHRNQLIETFKDVGSVTEVFQTRHKEQHGAIMDEYAGRAAIGHVRYSTVGQEDRNYAQPFERHHIKKNKWFSFAFNGQLSNYKELREELLADGNTYLARDTDTEIIMHTICTAIASPENTSSDGPNWVGVCKKMAETFDGAYNVVFLNAQGEMFVARDPLGIKPLLYAIEGPLFAAASESVALFNLGFSEESIKNVEPGQVIIVSDKGIRFEQFAESQQKAHCFFEWAYFANVASTLDGKSVYMARKNLGAELARQERENGIPIDSDTIVVPVPDTSKAAADSMAYHLGIPSLEGLIRNRYSGRTFIEGGEYRIRKAQTKYTPLREVLKDKKIFLVEDSIVRSTTMRVLLQRIRELGQAREIHVRVACPPITSPCFYGIDMPTYTELYATQFIEPGKTENWRITAEIERKMAADLGADSVRFLPVEAISRSIGINAEHLCQACFTDVYPTPYGKKQALAAKKNS